MSTKKLCTCAWGDYSRDVYERYGKDLDEAKRILEATYGSAERMFPECPGVRALKKRLTKAHEDRDSIMSEPLSGITTSGMRRYRYAQAINSVSGAREQLERHQEQNPVARKKARTRDHA